MDNAAFRSFVDEVKARTDIVQLIGQDIALEPAGSVLKGRSPKNRDTDPSFVVWPDSQRWHDYSGGDAGGGDCLDYLVHVRGMAFPEALRTLAGDAGVPIPGMSAEDAKVQAKRLVQRRRIEELLTEAASYYHRILPTKIRRELYQRHYGFTDEIIDTLMLGWGSGDLFAHLIDACTATRDEVLSTGLFVLAGGGEAHELFRWRLVMPYWKAGRVVYFIARRTEYTPDDPWEQAKYKKLLTHSDKHRYVSPFVTNDTFYNEDAARTADELLVTEGVTDCISAMQGGIACISPVTVRFRKQDHAKLVSLSAKAKRIVICNDAEDSGAGEAGALETARVLNQAGRDVRLATIPRPPGVAKVDVNELVKASGPEALQGVIAAAKRLPKYLLECIPADMPKADLARRLEPVLGAVTRCQPLERDAYIEAIAKRFDVKVRAVQELLKTAKRLDVSERSTEGTRPTIAMGSQIREMVAQAWQAIHTRNTSPWLFARSGAIVRIARDETGSRIETLDEAAVLEVLGEVADWSVETDEGARNVFPPGNVTRVVHSRPRGLPVLQAILTAPSFAANGRILVEPGYHPEAHAWLELPDGFELAAVPEVPSEAEVAAARTLFFDELLVDFPFAHPSDRAHMLALLLLPFARRLIDGLTPLHLVDAPAAGSGKGLLVALVGVLATGTPASGGSIPDSTEEVRKKLTSELASGHPLVVLDNADEKKRLDSADLASVLTMPVWKDRLLGQTKMLSLPNHVVWIATGNNVRLSTELARRSVRIRIDAKSDRPWLRSGFRHPALIQWACANRAALVHAALTLIQNWLARGRHRGTTLLGSFEPWAETMGGILSAAGVEGFLGNLDALYETADAESTMWRELVGVWWATHRDAPVRVAELAELCAAGDLLEPVLGDGSEKSQHIRLGRALGRVRDRVFGEHRIETATDARMKRQLYRLVRVGREDGP